MQRLPAEEYIEQAHLFHGLHNRVHASDPVQSLLKQMRYEVLATTKLPMAIDYMVAELSQTGMMSTAMKRMGHYFEPFQSFLIASAEDDLGRFDMGRALLILEHEAKFRSTDASANAMFFFQFETLCQNRLDYDSGLAAMAEDGVYDEDWKRWILTVRHKIGLVQLGDLVFVHSQHYVDRQKQQGGEVTLPDPLLFSEREGRIALANRSHEPQYLFSALQRQLSYPAIPKPKPKDSVEFVLPNLTRTVERLETRIKLLEDENRERGIDLSQFTKNIPRSNE
jgi:hypothetical protein